jgi:hypothetical protein
MNNKIHYIDRAKEIIEIYKDMTGRSVIPKGTDLTRTYQWRYIVKFLEKMEDIPWDTTKKIVKLAIEYAKENIGTTVWSRGLWILTKSDIVDIAYEKAFKKMDVRETDIDKVIRSYQFAMDHDFNFNSAKDDSFPNIVIWYENGHICLTYMAMSNSCEKALSSLSESDRCMLPSKKEIESRRINCILDSNYNLKLKNIMKSDFIKLL